VICEFQITATAWQIQGQGQGYEPAFINMFVVRSSSVVAAGGLGQVTNSSTTRGTILKAPSFQAKDPSEISRRTGPSVSVRGLSIPERARDAFRKGLDRLTKKRPGRQPCSSPTRRFRISELLRGSLRDGCGSSEFRDQKEAEQAFQQSIDASGGRYAAPHFGLSVLLCYQQKFTEAEAIIRKALELAPSFGPSYFTLAWALFGLNRLDEAEKNAHEALMRNPTFAPAHFLLANIYNRRSDFSAALVELDACLRLAPDGAPSDQARRFQEFIKEKFARSTLILEAARVKP
jgi:tetratricopeptide (TPR) repeat protein